MPLEVTCGCTLCNIGVRLLSDTSSAEAGPFHELFSGYQGLRQYSSVSALLLHLRMLTADARSDELLRELVASRRTNSSFIESVLVLAFLPMLHGAIRRVARQQLTLAQEDITQQALSFLLQYLRSDELRSRQSHFAFAISRAVKRQVFEWGRREGMKNAVLNHSSDILTALPDEESFERHAQLRHFLHRCATKGHLTGAELDLLVQFKLEGANGDDFENSNGSSPNALRQRLKRLLAKLRHLAE
jgi:hypothetical protein